MPIRFARAYTNNGNPLTPRASTDAHFLADDIVTTQDWQSRAGTLTFFNAGSGVADHNVETPFYKTGGYAGTGYRKGATGSSPTGTGYYYLVASPSNDFGPTSTVSMIFVVKAGSGFITETLWDNYTFLGQHNVLVQLQYDGVNPYRIRAYSDFDISPAECFINIKPYENTIFMVTFNGPAKTINLYTLDDNQNSTGVGNYSDNFGTTYFGFTAPLGTDQLTESAVIEMYRCQEILNIVQFRAMARQFYGLTADTGQESVGFSRGTLAEVEVNNSLWRMPVNAPCINQDGIDFMPPVQNGLTDSSFTETFGAYWTTFAAGADTTISANTTDASRNRGIGGKAYEIATGALLDEGYFHQTTAEAYGAADKMCFSLCWRAAQSGARVFYQIKNTTTNNYYNATTQLWQVAAVNNVFTASDTARRTDHLLFANDAAAGSDFYVAIGNGADAANAGKSLLIYHVQMAVANDEIPAMRMRDTQLDGARDADSVATYDAASSISFTLGKIVLTGSLAHNSTTPPAADRCFIGCDGMIVSQASGSKNVVLSDGTNTATLTDNYSAGEVMTWSAYFNAGGFYMGIENLTKASIATSPMGAAIDVGSYLGVGGTAGSPPYMRGKLKQVIIK